MKKYLFTITILLILALFACNRPTLELVQQIEQSRQQPYSENLDYTLTDDDYNTIATVGLSAAENAQDSAACKSIKIYHSFGYNRPAAKFVPPFLGYKFPALDSGSYVRVTYNYDNTYIFTQDEQILLPNSAYSDLGLSHNYFDPDHSPDQLIPQWLNSQDQYSDFSRLLVRYLYQDTSGQFEARISYFERDPATGWYHPDVYMLSDQDYENVAPNTEVAIRHYFTADYPPNVYVAALLRVKFPYAIAGDQKAVIYKYYDKALQYHYNIFTYDGQNWNSISQKTDQFFNDGQRWAFDPTVRFTMSCSDYQIIVSYVQEHYPEYMHPLYNNTEYYYGASSYYCNFDMRLNVRRSHDTLNLLPADDQQAMKVLWDRVVEAINIMLEIKYPDAQPEVYGVPVYYYVTFQTYEPPRKTYYIKFRCTDVGKFAPVPQDGSIEYNQYIVPVEQ